ncbi:MAG: hypothetical protein HY553_11055 [Elusimicrobia bacterium]|nr:hypothetical protein [Elusimicrobiota bacterium]
MSYQVKRIDPYWMTHPMIPVGVVAGAVLALVGHQSDKAVVGIAGLIVAGISVVLAAKPVISAVLGTLGVFGGLVTFVILPQPQMVGMPIGMRFVSTILFALLYMVLMDALVLAIAFLYNLFGAGMRGIGLDIEETAGEEA